MFVYRFVLLFALTGLLFSAGCGRSGSAVIVDPNPDPAAAQEAYDDYDKQMAADAGGYQ